MAKQSSLLNFGFTNAAVQNKAPPKGKAVTQREYDVNKRSRSFVASWVDEFPGIFHDNDAGVIFCTTCQKYPNVADQQSVFFAGGCGTYRKQSLQAHWLSPRHIRCVEAKEAEERAHGNNLAGPIDIVIKRMSEKNRNILKKVFNTAYMILKCELPFTLFPNMLKLQIKNGSDIDRLSSYRTNTACRRFTQYIVDDVREPLRDAIENARVFSVIYDGATDASVTEVEIVYCRYLRDGKPVNCFVNLQEVEHAHAEGVFSAIDNAMVSAGIENWKGKLVGAGSDGAKVNIGINNSVATRMQRDGREHVVIVHCVAHRLELAILGAIKESEMLQIVQDMLNKIHKHYHYSPKALRELEMVADAMGEKFIKPQRLSGTRWVPHVRGALQVLISKYPVILAHFEHVSELRHGSTAEVQGRAKFLVKKLKDFRVVKFMMFMEDLLEIISILSLEFQKDDATAVDILDAMDTATFSLVELGQKPGNALQNFLDTVANNEGKYKGVLLTNYNDGTVAGHYQNIVDCTVDHISNRLTNSRDKARSVLEAARIFDVRDWPTTRGDLPPYGNQELDTLLQQFVPILSRMGCNQSELKKEWIQLKAHVGNLLIRHPNRNQAPSLSTFFLTDDYRKRFHNILMLVEIVFVLPMSSAVCERGFSAVNRIKSDWRASLSTEMLSGLLLVSIEGPELMEYDPEGALHRWWTAGQRSRRPTFEVAQRDDDDDDASEDEDELLDFILGQQE